MHRAYFMRFLSNPYFGLICTSWKYSTDSRKKFVLFYVLSILANSATLLTPYVFGRVFNTLQKGGTGMLTELEWWLAAYAGLSALFWALHGPSRIIERKIAFRIKENFIDDMYGKLKSLPMKWHQDHHSGNTINRINKAATALYSFSEEQFVFITFIIAFFGPVFALLFISPPIAGMACLCSITTIFILSCFDRVIIPLLEQENNLEHHFSSAFFDYVSNITTIISLRIGERTRSELHRRLASIFPIFNKSIVLNEYKWFVLSMCTVLIDALIILFYIWHQLHMGIAIMIGTTITVHQYLRSLSSSFSGFAARYESVIRWRTNCNATRFIEEAYTGLPPAATATASENWQHISIRHLRFSYEDREHHMHQLQNIDFDIERGQRIALVGESGSGKSTLLGLLRGLYEAEGTEVAIDGEPQPGLSSLSALTTLIPQEPEIFENTVSYNITTGLEYDNSELDDAIRIACFKSVVSRFPQGVDTDIREKGVNMSGGEKQRLALARGIFAARGSSLLLLDEPTSSVDNQNEMRIYANLFEAFAGCTIISSIHRLHLLPNFDRIYVMHDRRIIEQGTLKELLETKGRLYTAWQEYNKAR